MGLGWWRKRGYTTTVREIDVTIIQIITAKYHRFENVMSRENCI